MKVYIVTRGAYSDYCIDTVFADKALAEQHVKTLNYGGDIEEWDVNDIGSDRDSGRTPFTVRMLRNGTPIEVSAHSPDYTFSSGCHYYFDYYSAGRNLVNTCLATGELEAVKITNELRAVILSENKWGVD